MTPPTLFSSGGCIVLLSLCLVAIPFPFVRASPLPNEPRSTPLPILKLPYASYQASSFNAVEDIYTFKNIRYAAPPVGDLRWAKPAPPPANTTLQDGSYGPSCVQTSMKGLNVVGPGNNSPVGASVNQFLSGIPIPLFDTGDEDCLFLDLYVPGKALRAALASPPTSSPPTKLPVVVWIFGGGYLMGSKDALQPELPFYDGSALIHQSGGGLIFVAPNYRLGAYGFLAGTTMERDGLPNAGLWDQRAALQWVQDHIALVGGDPDQVTAMGESAGAGSLMHHLTAAGGALAPLFHRAILQSPAYQWMWDRAGHLETTFQTFAALAGCGGARGQSETNASSLACLRAADAATLVAANAALMDTVPAGSFAVGPAADGTYVRQLPVLELATGHHAVAGTARGSGSVEALVLSHCSDEATLFVSGTLGTDAAFSGFLNAIFPNYTAAGAASGGSGTSINEQILAFYPPVAQRDGPYGTESARVEAFLRDSCFTCHVRHITESVGDGRVWNMQYAVTPGWHGTDLVPTFFDTGLESSNSWLEGLVALFVPAAGVLVRALGIGMQGYFASFAATGNPNTERASSWLAPTIPWNHPDSGGEQIAGVLNVGDGGFSTVRDAQAGKAACTFWHSVAAAVTSLGGYAPPGAVVDQALVAITKDPSANYVGGNKRS